jgi:flagellar biosynthesis anti-sigma factor FlgM
MRIPDYNPYANLEEVVFGTSGPKKSSGPDPSSAAQPDVPAGSADSGDTVQISSRAQEIAGLLQSGSGAPELLSAKALEIQSQITDGTYQVKPEEIARQLVKETIYNQIL